MTIIEWLLIAWLAVACTMIPTWFIVGGPFKTSEVIGVVLCSIAWPLVVAAFTVVAGLELLLGEWSTR